MSQSIASPQVNAPQEIELKLGLAPGLHDQTLRWLEHRAGAPAMLDSLDTVYYDTPDRQLRSRRVTLRIRRSSQGATQTLKGGGGVTGGLHVRDETNWSLPESDVSPAPLLCREVMTDIQWENLQLEPLFRTSIERHRWELDGPDGGRIEIVLDSGWVEAGDTRLPIHEMEFELLQGSATDLFDLALEIVAAIPCQPINRSKAARGHWLASARERGGDLPSSGPAQDGYSSPNIGMADLINAAVGFLEQRRAPARAAEPALAGSDALQAEPFAGWVDWLLLLTRLRLLAAERVALAGSTAVGWSELAKWIPVCQNEFLQMLRGGVQSSAATDWAGYLESSLLPGRILLLAARQDWSDTQSGSTGGAAS